MVKSQQMSQLSHAEFPLRRHPPLLVDHRRAGSASVADSPGADAERLTGSGGRLHFGTVAGIKSERWPDCIGIRTCLSVSCKTPFSGAQTRIKRKNGPESKCEACTILQEALEFLEFFARGLAPPVIPVCQTISTRRKAASYAPNWGSEHFRACDVAKVTAADMPGYGRCRLGVVPCQDPCRYRRRAQRATVPGRSGPSGTDESIERR